MPITIPNDTISHFAPLPWNFDSKTYKTSVGTAAPKLIDGRTDTFEGPGDGVYIVADTTSQVTTHLYIVASGVTSFTITGHPNSGTDGSGYSVTNTNYSVVKSNNLPTKYTWGGRSYYMFELNRAAGVIGWDVTAVQVNVTGASARVYEIAAIKSEYRLDIDDQFYRRVDFESREPRSRTYTSIRGRTSKAILPGVGIKYDLHATYDFIKTDTMTNKNADDLRYFLNANPNFAFIPCYSYWPNKVFTRAIVPQASLRELRENEDIFRSQLPITIRQA